MACCLGNVFIGGSLIELDNGWRLTTARIAGDNGPELLLNGVTANRNVLLSYGISDGPLDHWLHGRGLGATLLAGKRTVIRLTRLVTGFAGIPAVREIGLHTNSTTR
jgi:hypothetical protein